MESMEFVERLWKNSAFNDMPCLLDDEKEVALKLLNALDGLTIIRATEVLEFCSQALQYTKFNIL